MSETQATMTCPVCGKLATRLVSGGAGLHFKGSGFYITDYGKSGSKKESKESKASGDGASSGDTTKSDKPAAPTPPAVPSDSKSSGRKSSGSKEE
jgi:predicted nucleic acid-binding Zn ribbon protein